MKKLKCSEIGGFQCEYESQGETDEEATKTLFEHGESQHKEALESWTDEKKEQVNAKIKEKLAEQE